MFRKNKKYSIEEVFDFVKKYVDVVSVDPDKNESRTRKRLGRFEFDGDMMKPWSLRYLTFIVKGTKCSCCGIEATHFYKERALDTDPYHFNLYGFDADGNEVLFTKDHHHPKSDGGKDVLSNMKTMCYPCNFAKASTIPND